MDHQVMAGNDLSETGLAGQDVPPASESVHHRHPDDEAFLDSLRWVEGRQCVACKQATATTLVSVLGSSVEPLCRRDLGNSLGWARSAAQHGHRLDGYHPSQVAQAAGSPAA